MRSSTTRRDTTSMSATRPQRVWFDPNRVGDVLTPSQIRFADLVIDGDALLRAAVRADERAQGAFHRGRFDLVDRQGNYSDRFFDAFIDLQPETARLAEAVADEIQD